MHSTVIVPSHMPPGTIVACSCCGHKWALRKKDELPKNCPKCRSTLWMKKYYRYTCMKCGHEWGTANDSPTRCPKCHTSRWNAPPIVRKPRKRVVRSRLPNELKSSILSLYNEGVGCFAISTKTNLAFGDVMDVLVEEFPGETIKI